MYGVRTFCCLPPRLCLPGVVLLWLLQFSHLFVSLLFGFGTSSSSLSPSFILSLNIFVVPDLIFGFLVLTNQTISLRLLLLSTCTRT